MAKSKTKAGKSKPTSKRGKGAEKVCVATQKGKKGAEALTPASESPAPEGSASSSSTGVIGLSNLGNTCFFNSVLQVLVASPPLQQFFSQTNHKVQQAPLSGGLHEVFQQAQSKPVADEAPSTKPGKAKKQKLKASYAPQRLHTAVCKHAPHFKGFQEQDSHELLRVLLDGIQGEEARGFESHPTRSFPSEEDEWKDAKKGSAPAAAPAGFLAEVFAGQLSSTVTCETCQHQSTTLEPFMDLSLPIPVDLTSQLDSFDRRSKKGRLSRKGEVHAAETAVDKSQLSHKERKKLLKEEKKAAKLANKGKPKPGKDKAAAALPGTSADASAQSTLTQAASALIQEATDGPQSSVTQPRQLNGHASHQPFSPSSPSADMSSDAATSQPQPEYDEETQPLQEDATASAGSASKPSSDPGGAEAYAGLPAIDTPAEPSHSAGHAEPAESPEPFEPAGHAEPAEASEPFKPAGHAEPAEASEPSEPAGHAEPAESSEPFEPAGHAEPRDALEEFAALSPRLPDMPKVDYSDDLPGLFRAAFATCDELSPRKAASLKSAGDLEAEDLSLYDDAEDALQEEDRASDSDGVVLDASDEEEEQKRKSGPVARPLLRNFVNDAGTAAISTVDGAGSQAEASGDGCDLIGDLFEEPDEDHLQHHTQADLWQDEDDESCGQASQEATLQSCLKEFFSQEHITWECPAEKQSKKKTRNKSLAEHAPATPLTPATPEQETPNGYSRRTVSFSEAEPVVRLIPGSVEQRGVVFRSASGDPPYCRPLRVGGAYLLLTTSLDVRRPTRMHIKVMPRDDEEATLMLASDIRHLATADVPAPKVGESEDEVRLGQAQVLMDCTADLLAQKGMEGLLAWCQAGLKLKQASPSSSPNQHHGDTHTWIVVGQIPLDEGAGKWEYPACTTESSSSGPLPADSDPPVSPSPSTGPAQDKAIAAFDSPADIAPGSADTTAHQGPKSGHTGNTASDSDAQQQAATVDGAQSDEPAKCDADSSESNAARSHQADATPDGEHDERRHAAASSETRSPSDAVKAESNSQHAAAGVSTRQQNGNVTDSVSQQNGVASGAGIQQYAEASGSTSHQNGVGSDSITSPDTGGTSQHEGPGSDKSSQQNGVIPAGGKKKQGGRKAAESRKDGEPPSPATPPKKGGLINVQRPAVKGYLIHRCPPLLTIHVKRFQQDMRGRLSKLDGKLPFSLDLDLQPFCDPKGPDAAGARYTLLGFVQHMGTMRSGHYEACVQRGLTLAHSPALQALLRKHGIALPADALPSDSSTTKPGKRGAKAPAKAPAGRAKGDAGDQRSMHGQPDKGGRVRKGSAVNGNAAQSISEGSVSTTAQDDTARGNTAKAEGAKAGAAQSDAGTNGKAVNGVPEDWDASDSSSATAVEAVQEETHAAAGKLAHDSLEDGATDYDVQPADSASSEANAAHEQPQQPKPRPTDQVLSGQAAHSSSASAAQQIDDAGQSEDTSGPRTSLRTWYCISDAHVRVISEADVLSREAYILLYMRLA